MKATISLLWMSILTATITPTNDACTKAHSAASYALFHAKKSLKADNFDHQRYYAERAIEAFKKTQEVIDDCGCDKAKNAILDGIENLTKAAEAEDWDKGRFYTKKGHAYAQDVIGFLDECTSGIAYTTVYTIDNTETVAAENIMVKKQELTEEEQKLEEAKRRLEEEKRKLEEKLAEQRRLKEALEKARQEELAKQKQLKIATEDALANLETAIYELTIALDCKTAYSILKNYSKTYTDLEKESLDQTKNYYILKAKEIADNAMQKLVDCTKK